SMDPSLRAEAAMALALLGADNPDVFPTLREIFQEKSHPFRIRALEALARLGRPGEEAVAIAVRMLWDDSLARPKAAEVLGRMGLAAKSAIADLVNVLKGSDNPARIPAALALW